MEAKLGVIAKVARRMVRRQVAEEIAEALEAAPSNASTLACASLARMIGDLDCRCSVVFEPGAEVGTLDTSRCPTHARKASRWIAREIGASDG
jgi:hypothetical protein